MLKVHLLLYLFIYLISYGTGENLILSEIEISKNLTFSKINNTFNIGHGLNSENLGRIFTFFMDYSKTSIKFYLFSNRRNGAEEIQIDNPSSVRKSQFESKRPLKLLIHGYRKNGFSDFPHTVKDAYLGTEEEINVICVDWRRQASERVYFNSAFNTRMVGERVGEFILFLKDFDFIDSFDVVHLVGFSLGAQVAGYAGKFIYSTRNQILGRITGLDPAGPAFTGPDPKNRLDSTDAAFVDIIHTSIWKSGLWKSIGHVDFYPNGGEFQPGCSFENVVDPFLGGCSHIRAVELFVESIKNIELEGCKCGNWTEYERGSCDCTRPDSLSLLGEHCDKRSRGNFYLRTEAAPPFVFKTSEISPSSHPTFNETLSTFINSFIQSNSQRKG